MYMYPIRPAITTTCSLTFSLRGGFFLQFPHTGPPLNTFNIQVFFYEVQKMYTKNGQKSSTWLFTAPPQPVFFFQKKTHCLHLHPYKSNVHARNLLFWHWLIKKTVNEPKYFEPLITLAVVPILLSYNLISIFVDFFIKFFKLCSEDYLFLAQDTAKLPYS